MTAGRQGKRVSCHLSLLVGSRKAYWRGQLATYPNVSLDTRGMLCCNPGGYLLQCHRPRKVDYNPITVHQKELAGSRYEVLAVVTAVCKCNNVECVSIGTGAPMLM